MPGWGLVPGGGIVNSKALMASKGLVCSPKGELLAPLSLCWWEVTWGAEGGWWLQPGSKGPKKPREGVEPWGAVGIQDRT